MDCTDCTCEKTSVTPFPACFEETKQDTLWIPLVLKHGLLERYLLNIPFNSIYFHIHSYPSPWFVWWEDGTWWDPRFQRPEVFSTTGEVGFAHHSPSKSVACCPGGTSESIHSRKCGSFPAISLEFCLLWYLKNDGDPLNFMVFRYEFDGQKLDIPHFQTLRHVFGWL